MLVKGIKSRPVYTGLAIDDNAQRHLFALEGEGAAALADQVSAKGKDFLSKAEILYVSDASKNATPLKSLEQLKPDILWSAPSIPVLLNRLRQNLVNAHMGSRLYLSGTEGFIGQCMKVALEQDVDFNSIMTEHRGSEARRVQCVHCKGITENVKTQPFTCTHCGVELLVRDHYSRRLAAFQGVCIDAEEPGTAPPQEVMFP
jgi:dimethylamine monooxygenase subunit C